MSLSRQILNLPSKRKLDDYALLSLPSSNPETLDMIPHHHSPPNPNPNPNPTRPRVSSSSSSSPSSPSSSSSSSTVQFFVRTDSKTLALRVSRHSTVGSVISRSVRCERSAGHYRVIYLGRQLDPDSTLHASRVSDDSTLHLAARLRSTRLPRSHMIVGEILSAASGLYSGRRCCLPHDLDGLLTDFLASTPLPSPAHDENTAAEHLSIFALAAVPAALVKLYLSRHPGCRLVAENAVRVFLKHAPECIPKLVHPQCSVVVLEFCKLIANASGREDQLYADCRSAFASLLESASSGFRSLKGVNLADELYPFVIEMAEMMMDGIQSTTMDICANSLSEFSSFLSAMRTSIEEWMGLRSGRISIAILNNKLHPRHECWVVPLHAVFLRVLMKVDACLGKFNDLLAQKGLAQGDKFLALLCCVRKFSKIYEGGDELLHKVLLARRASVNALIWRAKRNVKLKWLLGYKDVTDFESRQNLSLMLFPEGKDDYERMHEMLIDRFKLLEESFEYIGQVEGQALHGGLFVEFKNESATGPGVLREWFTSVCKEIFNPENVLFMPCPNDRRRFFPNPASVVDPLNLKYFSFCGRVIALALMHKVQVGVVLDRAFFLQLAGKTITLEDVKDADPCLYTSCKQILEMDAELLDSDSLGLTFVRVIEELGSQREVELCHGGKDRIVDSNNREEYINLLIQHRFVTSTSDQVSHFARGFSDILSNSKLKELFFLSLDLEDFDRMLGGSDGINVSDWRAHTEYNGYKVKDRVISWFWKVVEGMSDKQRRVLLFFWTSIKYLPVDGFRGLASKLYIYKVPDASDHLPTSHTCFYRICLPQYPSFSAMQDRLQFITQEHVSCSFGMW